MMTQDEIIEMARQAGWPDWEIVGMKGELKSFAKLVAAKTVEGMVMMTPDEFKSVWNKAQAEEREACAKVCEDREEAWRKAGFWKDVHEFREMAFYIRARGAA
jgi:hypothetical protein